MQISVEEVARTLSVPQETVITWANKGKIPAARVYDQWEFDRDLLLEWAATHGLVLAHEPEPAGWRPLFLALRAGGVHLEVPGSSRDEVLSEVVARMPVAPEERVALAELLRTRELAGSTGIGHGIAIPHAIDPLLVADAQPTVTLCFLRTSVDFDAVDQAPVHSVFALVSPTVRAHHHLLAQLSRALHDETFRRAMDLRAPDELLEAAHRLSD